MWHISKTFRINRGGGGIHLIQIYSCHVLETAVCIIIMLKMSGDIDLSSVHWEQTQAPASGAGNSEAADKHPTTVFLPFTVIRWQGDFIFQTIPLVITLADTVTQLLLGLGTSLAGKIKMSRTRQKREERKKVNRKLSLLINWCTSPLLWIKLSNLTDSIYHTIWDWCILILFIT